MRLKTCSISVGGCCAVLVVNLTKTALYLLSNQRKVIANFDKGGDILLFSLEHLHTHRHTHTDSDAYTFNIIPPRGTGKSSIHVGWAEGCCRALQRLLVGLLRVSDLQPHNPRDGGCCVATARQHHPTAGSGHQGVRVLSLRMWQIRCDMSVHAWEHRPLSLILVQYTPPPPPPPPPPSVSFSGTQTPPHTETDT